MKAALMYLSGAVHDELEENIEKNLACYLEDGFSSRSAFPGWSIKTGLEIDTDFFLFLNPERSASSDCENSLTVYHNLKQLTPAQACDPRLWTRLTHVEGFEYSRARWIDPWKGDKNCGAVKTHFFAAGRTGIRDDNALSRLWWNGYIASQCRPENPESALRLLLSSLDVRKDTIERIWITSRVPLLAGILRIMEQNEALRINASLFGDFMKKVNQLGGGVVFEVMNEPDIDRFLVNSFESASRHQ